MYKLINFFPPLMIKLLLIFSNICLWKMINFIDEIHSFANPLYPLYLWTLYLIIYRNRSFNRFTFSA